jgi:hypothetical protein
MAQILGTWDVDADPNWTVLLYKKIRRASSDICGCVYCKIWASRRDQAFCETCRKHLERLGIDLKLDTGNSPVLLDRDLLYVVQYRVKGVAALHGPKKEYVCPTCKTKAWILQDTLERHIILLNLAVTLPLDAAARDMIAASQVVKSTTGGFNRI